MKPTRFTAARLLQPFARKKVLTKAELLQACGCSPMTAWRILHQQGYLTSYNHNAKYYTLAHIPRLRRPGAVGLRRHPLQQVGEPAPNARGPASNTAPPE